MNSKVNFIVSVLILAVSAFSSTVVEDSRSRFVLDDQVENVSVLPCIDSLGSVVEGFTFAPERSYFDDGNAVPFRKYRIAVPDGASPEVSLSNVKTVELNRPFCKGETLRYPALRVSQPVLRDGLWMVDVSVPLYEPSHGSLRLRKSFRLKVDFPSGSASGVNPGKRALSRVENIGGAARFGTISSGTLRKALRRSSASDMEDVHFLAQINVGDKEISTFEEDGQYAVDFRSLRNAMMLVQRHGELDGIPVKKLCLWGGSPDTLASVVPAAKSVAPNHLHEIPIEIRDHSNGGAGPANEIFDDGDTLVFVGYGSGFWKRVSSEDSSNKSGMEYFHSYSPYSYYQGFYLGWKASGKGLRLSQTLPSPAGRGRDVSWVRYVRGEKDAMLRDTYFGKALDWESSTGKEWFWYWHARPDSMGLTSGDLSMPHLQNMPGLVSGGRQYVAVSFFPHRSVSSTLIIGLDTLQWTNSDLSNRSYSFRMSGIRFSADLNGQKLLLDDATLLPGGNFAFDVNRLKSSGNNFAVTLLPNRVQCDRFDGYTFAYEWKPTVDSTDWLLPGAVSGVIRIPVSGSNVRLMKFRNLVPVGLLNVKNGVAVDSVSPDEDVRYLAYRADRFSPHLSISVKPVVPEGVLENLSRINSKTEYLVVSAEDFLEPAVQLGNFRTSGDAVNTFPTTVVSAEDIYRDYGGSLMSPVAIRNYIAYAYSVCPNLKYVLLAGAGHYDYRGFNSRLYKNFIPPFEMDETVTEEFFGVLDSGEMVRTGEYDVDLAVGRLPVQSVREFDAYLDKVKDYEQRGRMDYSSWRSTVLFAADDAINGSQLDNTGHTRYVENVISFFNSNKTKPFSWNVKKVYLLDYKPDAGGQKKDAAEDFINVLNQGALMTTYFGHGSITDWAGEGLLKPAYISKLTNRDRYTILTSISCTVGRFDQGKIRSLSEEFLLADHVGSIASIGATRETYAKQNAAFGQNLVYNVLEADGDLLGDAFVKTKNLAGTPEKNLAQIMDKDARYNNEHYVLIGEPVIQLPSIKKRIILDQKLDTLKALDKVKLSGRVAGLDEGRVNLSIREGRVLKSSYTGIPKDDRDTTRSDTIDVEYLGSLIFSEDIPVAGGRFETEFITPKKMSFGDTSAEFSAWAYSSREAEVGALTKNDIVISGFSDYADSLNDETPPSLSILPCYSGIETTHFSDGQTVKLQSPACLQVIIEDSTALDYREQADEGISFEVVGVENPYHPQIYMEQNSRRAVLRKTFAAVTYPEGHYVFKVRAQDVLGNSSAMTLNVDITSELKSGLADVFNIPNPVGKKGTTFYFKNLAIDRATNVNIFIYNQNGRLVKVLKNAVSGVTHWDGRDNHGRLLANGLYHYVVRNEVSATENVKKSTWTKKQKLLISR